MSNFKHPSAKIKIASLDQGSVQIEAQYNPKDLQVDLQVPWQKHNQANKSNEQGIHLEFTGAEGREMTVELFFDGYEQKKSIAPQIATIHQLASVIKAGSKKGDDRRPHRCVVNWGTTAKNFRCVIESVSTKYTMFLEDGTPVRATCTVKLKEADVVSMAKSGGGGGSGG
jgi:hypothetical protein